MHDVELVDDDGLTPAPAPTPGDDTDRRRGSRTALLVGAGLVVALVAAGVVGQALVDRRDQAVVDTVAAHPLGLRLLDHPPEVLWEVGSTARFQVGEVRTADDLLVGVDHTDTGPVAVHALDAATGREVWRTELVDGTTRPEPELERPGDMLAPWTDSGRCLAPPGRTDVVACSVHDGSMVWTTDGTRDVPPSTVRTVVLDTTDGTVLTDLADVTGDLTDTLSFAFLGDLLVLALPGDDGAEVVAVRTDGEEVWRRTLDGWDDTVFVDGTGAGVVLVRSTDEALLVDDEGRTVRTVPMRPAEGLWAAPTLPDVLLIDNGDDEGRGTSVTVLRPDGDVTVEGYPVSATVDDGSVPGLLLTSLDGSAGIAAWDADGDRLWTAEKLSGWNALVVDGLVVTESEGTLVALDARTGEERWRVSRVSALPMTDGRHVVVLTHEGLETSVVAYDLHSGDEVWRVPAPDGVDDLMPSLGLLLGIRSQGGDGSVHLSVLG